MAWKLTPRFGFLPALLVLQCALTVPAQQTMPDLVTQTTHTSAATTIAFNADGTLMATGGEDSTVKVWHVASGRLLRTLRGHTSPITGLAFHPTEPIVASTSAWDTSVRVWDLRRDDSRTLSCPSVTYGNLAFSPDGAVLIHGGPAGLGAWDLADERGSFLSIDRNPVECLTLSQDGTTLVAGNTEGEVHVWSKGRGKTEFARSATAVHRRGGIYAIVINQAADWFATAGSAIEVWNSKTGERVRSLGGTVVSVKRPLALSPDGRLLATAGNSELATAGAGISGPENSVVTLWDVRSWSPLYEFRHAAAVDGLSFEGTGRFLATAAEDGVPRLWDLATRTAVERPASSVKAVTSVAFALGGRRLAAATGSDVIVWDTEAGVAKRLTGHTEPVTAIAASPDGCLLASGSTDKTVRLWDPSDGSLVATIDTRTLHIRCVAFSPDGATVACGGEIDFDGSSDQIEGMFALCDVHTGIVRRLVPAHRSRLTTLAFSPDGKQLVTGSMLGTQEGRIPDKESTVRFWDASSGDAQDGPLGRQTVSIKTIGFDRAGSMLAIGRAAFNPTDPAKEFLAGGDVTISEVDAETGRVLNSTVQPQDNGEVSDRDLQLWDVRGTQRPVDPYTGIVTSLSVAPDGATLVTGSLDTTVKIWDARSGKILDSLDESVGGVNSVAFSSNGGLIAAGSDDGVVTLWSAASREEVAKLLSLEGSAWLVVHGDGRFDTNDVEEVRGLQWVFPDDRFRPLSPDLYLRDYYEPRLLPRVLSRKPLPFVRPLASLNRVQPEVRIDGARWLDRRRGLAEVRVRVGRASDRFSRSDGSAQVVTTDAYELRLFRDGQLVARTPSEAGAVFQVPSGTGTGVPDTELLAWRAAARIELGSDGTRLLRFPVRIPRFRDLRSVTFTAYAFNEDRLKSATASYTYKVERALSPVKGRAYVIAVGVSAYEDANWDLRFAAEDARATAAALARGLAATGDYSEVVPVVLTSERRGPRGGRVMTRRGATKAAFRAVLEVLARGPQAADRAALGGAVGVERLRRVGPEDVVIIAFSSHGYTDGAGKFYLVPYDTGEQVRWEGGRIAPETLSRFISSDELGQWLRYVDAGELALVVDTCHSAAAVDAEGFKPGPMGSRGMGQLAYDKGMRVLAASQAADVALEVGRLKHGLLTYALVREGLELGKADGDKDGRVTLEEWLRYGEERVPALYEEVKAGKVKELRARDVEVVGVEAGASTKKGAFQKPSLFDFKRKKREVVVKRSESVVRRRKAPLAPMF